MRVIHLSLADFRNYERADVSFAPGPNLVIGRNGQGKTNLVEAIAYFASLRSHRVSGDAALIRAGCDTGVARMRVGVGEREALLEIEFNRGSPNRAQINRNAHRPRELTRWFSAVVFAPEDLMVVRGDPAGRRRFLDDAVVALNPAMGAVMGDYERVVRQRTALLKSARANNARSAVDATLAVWDEQLVALGSRIIFERRRLVAALLEPLGDSYRRLVDADHRPRLLLEESIAREETDVSRETSVSSAAFGGVAASEPGAIPGPSEFDATTTGEADLTVLDGSESAGPVPDDDSTTATSDGADSAGRGDADAIRDAVDADIDVSRETIEADFRAALARYRSQELDRAVTLIGPHRDDLLLELNGLPVKGYASHGESWSVALALRLAVAELLRRESPAGDPVIILDDVFAELDSGRRERLMAAVGSYEQVIVTAAVEDDVPNGRLWHTVRIAAGAVVEAGDARASTESEPQEMTDTETSSIEVDAAGTLEPGGDADVA